MELENKIAIVTGGASGIGEKICRRLAREGASVIIADIAVEQAEMLARDLASNGQKALTLKVDVTKSSDTDEMAKIVLEKFGKIDILVNNAGGTARERKCLFSESEEEVWDWQIDLNLKSVRNCTRAVINHMIQRKNGKIVSVASVAGVKGSTVLADYSAAKAGIIGFTMAIAKEVAPYGINVNCVSPGPVASGALPEQYREAALKRVYAGRLGQPEDIANAVAFLVSDEASFIVGHNLLVDGGSNLGF